MNVLVHKCDLCGKKFSFKSDLMKHITNTDDQKQMWVCGKTFSFDLKYKTYNYFCCNYNTNLDFWQKNCISSDETSNIREQQYVFLQIYSFRICGKLYGYVWQWQWIFQSTLKTNVFKWLKYLKNNYLWLIVGTY